MTKKQLTALVHASSNPMCPSSNLPNFVRRSNTDQKQITSKKDYNTQTELDKFRFWHMYWCSVYWQSHSRVFWFADDMLTPLPASSTASARQSTQIHLTNVAGVTHLFSIDNNPSSLNFVFLPATTKRNAIPSIPSRHVWKRIRLGHVTALDDVGHTSGLFSPPICVCISL